MDCKYLLNHALRGRCNELGRVWRAHQFGLQRADLDICGRKVDPVGHILRVRVCGNDAMRRSWRIQRGTVRGSDGAKRGSGSVKGKISPGGPAW
eukprot:1194231-Prorocentrum_minimum.AAC.4